MQATQSVTQAAVAAVADQARLEAEMAQAALQAAMRRHLDMLDARAPMQYRCPISHEIMADPVIISDGQTFERASIDAWLRRNNTSPITNEPLASKTLTPNVALRSMIQDYMAQPMPPLPASGRGAAGEVGVAGGVGVAVVAGGRGVPPPPP